MNICYNQVTDMRNNYEIFLFQMSMFKCLVVCTAIYNVPFSSTHPSSLPVLSGVRITRSLILCVGFVDRCLSFCTFCYLHGDYKQTLEVTILVITSETELIVVA
jgi:hypothetical protein